MTREQRAQAWAFKNLIGFGEAPSADDLATYARGLMICASADGTLAPAEKAWILGYLSCMGAPDGLIKALDSGHVDLDLIGKVRQGGSRALDTARSLVFDAFSASSADGALHPAERKAIEELATEMGLTQSDFAKVQAAWELSETAHRNKIATLFPGATGAT